MTLATEDTLTETDTERVPWTEKRFIPLLGAATGLAAIVRLVYVFRDHRWLIGGDGYDYRFSALRLANGLGYTSAIGGDFGKPIAHHPPGWVTLLGIVNWIGPRTQRDDQLVGVMLGLGIVVLAGLIGRRYFSARVGLIAAVLAAIYPGFWVIEGNILSEPLDLFVVGLFTLAIASLHDRPTMKRSLIIGAICGVLALVRSEQLALLFIVVAPVLFFARSLSLRRRTTLFLAALFVSGVIIAPWTIYNAGRFKDPVLLSTNDGGLLLIGNCPPSTYSGDLLGYYDPSCTHTLSKQHPTYDRSQTDVLARHVALHNMTSHLSRLPIVVPARFGRLLAIYRPSQTVDSVAHWMTTKTWLIWAWMGSYLCLLPLALVGGVTARRSRRFLLPLLGPAIIVVVSVAIAYGEPRYHTPSDLGIVVLAAVGIDRLLARRAGSSARGLAEHE